MISAPSKSNSFRSFSGRWVKVGQPKTKPQEEQGDPPEEPQFSKPPKPIHEWVCPVCRLVLKSKNIHSVKAAHLKTRHPEFEIRLVQVPQKSEVVALSHAIPDDQREFTCPLCKKGLNALPQRERQTRIAAALHFIRTIPPKQLTNLAQKGRPKKNLLSQYMRDKLEKQR